MVIAGAGLAGARAVETLRENGFDGPVVLVGEEEHRPYERPPLSKSFLQGSSPVEEAFVHPEGWYEAAEVELLTGTRAADLHAGDQELVLEDGHRLRYERLLLATGSAARALAVPGADLPGVHLLRTLDDAEHLRAALVPAPVVVVIGSGWIGTEVAASARSLGCDVTIVGRDTVPLRNVLGSEVGAIFRDLHRDNGVRLVSSGEVDSVHGADRVEEVHLSDGRVLPCDLVVVGVGAAPRLELAQAAGLTVDGGIATDERLHTSSERVYAAGDVAAAWHPIFRTRLRVEHWANADHQGRVAAQNMLGKDVPYDRVPYFFSDQFDLGMEYSGHAPSWDEVVFRGDPARREFIAFWLKDRRVVAGMNANIWDVAEAIQALVRSGQVVDRARLSDPDVALDNPERLAA
jgi:3-phenylpropionate/trans-cinnamate dioxygenase ferredoxin reductase subunit